MFLTATSLVNRYGIDEEIAKFFVDREPPKDNLYWKDKQLYLRPQPGYIFLPLITDLLYRLGVAKQELLAEKFIGVLETIGHYAAMLEFGKIDLRETVSGCAAAALDKGAEPSLLGMVEAYFNGDNNKIAALCIPFKALHRGDVFLFAITLLRVSETTFLQLVKAWFALISTLLLVDDAKDIENDRQQNEENAFLQAGEMDNGFITLKEMLSGNLHYLSSINSTMANGLHTLVAGLSNEPFIQKILNN